MKKLISFMLLLALVVTVFSGCHGAAEKKVFEIPESFDTSRNYEITFWAKNDSNMTQVDIYKQAIADFEALGGEDARFRELAAIVKAHKGLWCAEAERYLLEHF